MTLKNENLENWTLHFPINEFTNTSSIIKKACQSNS